MLCRYFAIQLLIGAAVALALAELVWPKWEVGTPVEAGTDPISEERQQLLGVDTEVPGENAYDWDAGFSLKIPGFFRRHIPCEPCPTWARNMVAEAERVIRSRR